MLPPPPQVPEHRRQSRIGLEGLAFWVKLQRCGAAERGRSSSTSMLVHSAGKLDITPSYSNFQQQQQCATWQRVVVHTHICPPSSLHTHLTRACPAPATRLPQQLPRELTRLPRRRADRDAEPGCGTDAASYDCCMPLPCTGQHVWIDYDAASSPAMGPRAARPPQSTAC